MTNTPGNSIDISIGETMLTLLPQKCVYFKKGNSLLLADIHFGKAGHFRNAGIPVPSELAFADFEMLSKLLDNDSLGIRRLIVLGDMFHSKINSDWKIFEEWREKHFDIEIDLIKGNHDILSEKIYRSAGIEVFNYQILDNLLLVHNFRDGNNDDGLYKICGHVHPAVRIYGKARQVLTLPCYYFRRTFGVLPAFGRFTGRHRIRPDENDIVFAVMDREGEQRVVRV